MPETAAVAAPVWKRVFAVILDVITVFSIGGWAIARMTGNTTENGFNLNGMPAVVLFAVIVAYFFVCRRYLGGTLWDRILRIGRPQPN